jgi:transposase
MKKELELSEKIERRLEMIYAHTKLGKTIQEVIKEFCVCLDTYYYWYHRYVEPGIFGLFDSKRGPRHHITKSAMMLHPRSLKSPIAIQNWMHGKYWRYSTVHQGINHQSPFFGELK